MVDRVLQIIIHQIQGGSIAGLLQDGTRMFETHELFYNINITSDPQHEEFLKKQTNKKKEPS